MIKPFTGNRSTVLTTPTLAVSDREAERPARFPRFLATLFSGNLAIYLVWGSVLSLLLSSQIEQLAPRDKVTNLAMVSMIGAAVSVVIQPTWGLVSDRLRTRIGKRAPLLVLGAVLGGFALILLGISNSVLWITVSWCAVQVFVNMAQAPLQAVIPDRVPRRWRGTASTMMGLGLMGGTLVGSFYGAAFVTANAIVAGYAVLGGVLVLAMVVFVAVNPEPSNRDEPREPFRLGPVLRSLFINPVEHPDYFWTFLARLLLMLGYFGVFLYQLYILQDYAGLGKAAASQVPLLALASLAGSVVTMIVCGPWSDRIGRRKPFVIASSLVVGAGLLIPFFVPTVTGMLLYSLISGLGFGCYMAVDNALFTEVLPRNEDAGKDLGIANIAAALPQVLAPAVAGLVIAVTGGYQGLFAVALVLAVAGALCIIPIRSVR